MKCLRKFTTVLVTIAALNTLAWNTRAEFETASIRALHDKRYLVSDAYRTQLLSYAESPLDVESGFEARILLAQLHNRQYLNDMDLVKLTNECARATTFYTTVQISTNSWCSWGIPLSVGSYYAHLADDEYLFNLATNTIDKMVKGEIGNATNAMSQAYLAAQKMDNITPLQAFKALAVFMEHVRFHEIVRTASYTNDLPRRILVELLD